MTTSTTRLPTSRSDLVVRLDWPHVLLGMVALQFVWRGWALSQSYFWQDDFLWISRAGSGLTPELLVNDYNGHLQPLQFLVVWGLTLVAPLNWPAAAGLLLALQAGASLAVMRLVRILVGDGPAAAALLAVYLVSPVAFAASVWFAAALSAIPMQLVMAVVVTAWVQYLRGGGRRHAVVVVVGILVGLLWWEKALLLPPLLVAISVLVGPHFTGLPVRVLLRRARVLLGVLTALTVGYATMYLTAVDRVGSGLPSVGDVRGLLQIGVAETFVPGLLGGPWGSGGAGGLLTPRSSTALLILAWAALGLIVVATMVLARWAAVRAWALLLGFLLADIALVAAARLDFIGVLIARDPRYTADAVVVAVVTGCALVCALRSRLAVPGRDRTARSRGRGTTAVVLALGSAVVLSSVITSIQTLGRLPIAEVRTFVEGARSAAAATGGVDLVDGPVPNAVMERGFFVDDARVSVVLGELPVPPRFGSPTGDLRILDASGLPGQLDVQPFATTPVSSAPCPYPVGEALRALPLQTGVGDGRWVVRIGYYSAAPASGVLEVDERRYDVGLLAGLHHLYVEVDGEVRDVAVGRLTGGARVCATDVTVGTAVPRGAG